MSEIKTISRPKVRFSQFLDNQNEEKADKTSNSRIIVQTSGPKIKSIISLKKPVKIVKLKRSTDIHDADIPLSNCTTDNKISTYHNDATSKNVQNMSLSNDNVTIETLKVLGNTNNTQNSKENNMLQLDKSTYMQNNSLKHHRSLLQKGKENKDTIPNRTVSNNNNSITQTQTKNIKCEKPIIREKLKHSVRNKDLQKTDTLSFNKSKLTKSQSTSSVMKKTAIIKTENLNAKHVKSNVMPCYRYMKTGTTRHKVYPVKKTVLSSVTGAKTKTSIEPGISHKYQENLKVDDTNKKYNISSVIANKLAQPEYNSIMCTVNKLEELKQQKIVTDIDNLPPREKNVLNGKVSTALDFPLDEVIFKNLIDLSIDDRQLPFTVTRSKDPEPRQKDISPELADFFVPEYTKEICTAVHVKPRVSRIDENWSVFKISDKILDWKYSLDDFSQVIE